jgi:hypothetical protein
MISTILHEAHKPARQFANPIWLAEAFFYSLV